MPDKFASFLELKVWLSKQPDTVLAQPLNVAVYTPDGGPQIVPTGLPVQMPSGIYAFKIEV